MTDCVESQLKSNCILAGDLGDALLPFSVAATAATAALSPHARRQLNFVTTDFS